jgi:hypothetical protein
MLERLNIFMPTIFLKINRYFLHRKHLRAYVNFNKKIWVKKRRGNENKVLVEVNSMCSSHQSYAYLCNILSDKYNAKICGYDADLYNNLYERLASILGKIFNLGQYCVYRSFGVNSYVDAEIKSHSKAAILIYDEIIPNLKRKEDALAISISGIVLGDLIYDSYLRRYDEITVDVNDSEYRRYLLKAIALFLFWKDYFDINDVRALVISHCVYMHAIPLRIALAKNIPVYQASLTHIYKLSMQQYFAYQDFDEYRVEFKKINQSDAREALEISKDILRRRISGHGGVDVLQKSAIYEKTELNITANPENYNLNAKYILIAAHVFNDAPHTYGDFLFADFFDWIDFLNSKAKVDKNYIWLLKLHPDTSINLYKKINQVSDRWNSLVILEPTTTNNTVINMGIKAVLTVHGSIAVEFAMLDIPVISASHNNLYRAYSFVKTARSLEELNYFIDNVNLLFNHNNKKEIYEFYYMNNIYKYNIFVNDYKEMLISVGGYYSQFKPLVYDYFVSNFSFETHKKIMRNIYKYLDSNKYRMQDSLD